MEIKDSGERRKFDSGAVRDMQEGKGRFDLVPLEIVGDVMEDGVLTRIGEFVKEEDSFYLQEAYRNLLEISPYGRYETMILLSQHFEEGAKKYEVDNWKKGIPISSFIDSATRHYCKWRAGQVDENHYIACLWNITCCLWEVADNPKYDKPVYSL